MIALQPYLLDSDIDRDQQRQNKKQSLAKRVRGEIAGDDGVATATLEFLLSQPGECGSLTRVTSGRVTGAKRHAVVDTNASDLRLVDRARVIATRRRSSEGEDRIGSLSMPRKFDLINQPNRHGVSDIDCDDLRPTSRHFVKWIGDRDPFIEDQHFGANEDQIATRYDECCPESGSDATCKGEVTETLIGVDQRSHCSKREEDVSTSWSEDHRISHGQIISWRGL